MADEVVIDLIDGTRLNAIASRISDSLAVVVFAHGSGSSRHSARNRHVAERLHREGLGTLLLDLLTTEEESVDLRTSEHRFDIPLLGRRVVGAIDWLTSRGEPAIGLFGASTGAAAALFAAAGRPQRVGAVVSRGGRPDLAGDLLGQVTAPTLLIVGERDQVVLELNREAQARMTCPSQLTIVPGATHLFEEPGALDVVAGLAGTWFRSYLAP